MKYNKEFEYSQLQADVIKCIPSGVHITYLDDPIHSECGSLGLWQMLGYTEEEFYNTNGFYFNSIVEDDRDIFIEYLIDNAAGHGPETCEYRMVKKDGTIIYMLDRIKTFQCSDGVRRGYSSITDISEQKNKEENILRSLKDTEDINNHFVELMKFGEILCWEYDIPERKYLAFYNLDEVLRYTPDSYNKTLDKLKRESDAKNRGHEDMYYLLHEEDKVRFRGCVEALFKTGEIQTDMRLFCGDKKYHWFKIKLRISKDNKNIVIGHMFNVDAKMTQLNSLKKSLTVEKKDNRLLCNLIDFAGLLCFEYDIRKKCYLKCRNLESVMYYTLESYHKAYREKFDPEDDGGLLAGNMYYLMHEDDKEKAKGEMESLKKNGECQMEVRFLCGDQKYHWFKMEMNVQLKTDSIIGYMYNIDTKIDEIQKLREQTFIDPMTGLLNKVAAFNSIDDHLVAMPHQLHALLAIDVDDFKKINDTLGHSAGDRVLMHLAEIMKNIFRSDDILARFGGDEFIIFMKNIKTNRCAFERAEKIQELFRECTFLKDVEINLSVSIGVTFSEEFMTGKELFQRADQMLYCAKKSVKGTVFGEKL